MINTFKNFGQEAIHDDRFLTAVGAVSSVFGGLRFFWSFLVDRYSFKVSYTTVVLINVVFGATLVFVRDSKPLFMIWVSMLIWAEGAHFSLVPTICAKLFGKHAPIVYGVAFSFGALSQIISAVLVRFYIHSVGYPAFYYIGSAMSLAALCLILFVFEEKRVC